MQRNLNAKHHILFKQSAMRMVNLRTIPLFYMHLIAFVRKMRLYSESILCIL
jgi:hypothetical protein